MLTKEENYVDGYNTGLSWTSNYRPGGPYVCDSETEAMRKEWLRGFDDGLRERERVRKSNPSEN